MLDAGPKKRIHRRGGRPRWYGDGQVTPLIYGYLRVAYETRDEEILLAERELRRVAEAEGFCLVTIFHDCNAGSYAALNELTEELKRVEAHHVIVPSLAHLSRHPILRACMLAYLRLHADARVLSLDESWGGWIE